jgi:hypothetical protein
MCGDLDEDNERDQKLFARLLKHAKAVLAQHGAHTSEGELDRYLDTLFSDLLSRGLRDLEQVDGTERTDRFAMQPLVFARLAGFLAAHLPASEDPQRRVIEALMLGYSEAEQMEQGSGHPHGDVVARG